MKTTTSIRINRDILNHLRRSGINVSDYINSLILNDLKKNFDNSELKKAIKSAERDEKKKKVLNEMKIIGAIKNIETRIYNASKNDEVTGMYLIEKNINLLELEYENEEYSKGTKEIIKRKYKELKNFMLEYYEPHEYKEITK